MVREGFTAFDPSSIEKSTYDPPRVALTNLRVFNDEITPGPGAILEQPIQYTDQITLTHTQNDFTLDYIGLSYRKQGGIQYFYQLEPHDEEWVSARYLRSARYARLEPDLYHFKVRAMDEKGVLSRQEAAVAIRVLPPWWNTWWFRTLSSLLILLAVLGLYSSRVNWLLKQQELKQAQKEASRLAELDEAKNTFFADISHELRIPLTLIIGPLDDILQGKFGELDADLVRHVLRMQRSASELFSRVNQLLDLAKLEDNRMEISARRGNIISVIDTMVDIFTSFASQEHISIVFNYEQDEEINLYFEQEKIETVLANLLSNAIKFTDPHGKVWVRVKQVSSGEAQDVYTHVEIAVGDNGKGIPAKDIPFVFDRFYKGRKGDHSNKLGTGVGLALTRELVKLHGGEIRVESQEDIGSTFLITLPLGNTHLTDDQLAEGNSVSNGERQKASGVLDSLNKARSEPGYTEIMPPLSPPTDAQTVLVVEDHADLRAYVHSILSPYYKILEAENGEEGLEITRNELPDLIVSDVKMPVMDGFEFLQAN